MQSFMTLLRVGCHNERSCTGRSWSASCAYTPSQGDSIKTLHMQCKLLGGTFVTAECTQLLTAHQAELRIAALALRACSKVLT